MQSRYSPHCPAVSCNDQLFVAFIDSLNQTVDTSREPATASAAALENLARSGWLPADHRYLLPQPGCEYGSYLLYLAPSGQLCAVLDVFLPNQAADIHNHRTWGAFICLQGYEYETLYHADPRQASAPVERVRRPNPPGCARTASADRTALHRVETAAQVTSISLHVYGADILRIERDFWNRDSAVYEQRRSDYSNAAVGVDRYLF